MIPGHPKTRHPEPPDCSVPQRTALAPLPEQTATADVVLVWTRGW